jgi:hypothetical protein
MTKSDLKLVKGLLDGDPVSRHRAMLMLDAAHASALRGAHKAAPRKRAERATKEEQRGAGARARRTVFERALMCSGECEICHDAAATEWHHLAPAAMRRRFSGPEDTCAACMGCHRAWHRGDVETLERSYQLAGAIGAHRLVLDGIRRRIDKIEAQHPRSATP